MSDNCSDYTLGYCTNIHGSYCLEELISCLEVYPEKIRNSAGLAGNDLPVGLWVSNAALKELANEAAAERLQAVLVSNGLNVFTLNGFPYGDFHSDVVKYDVYKPDWLSRSRVDYTRRLIDLLAGLMPEGAQAGISTLPLGWPDPGERFDKILAAQHILEIAEYLKRVEDEQGKLIHLDIEPEPGCIVGSALELVDFYKNHLLAGADEAEVLRYVRVCHDICHSSVMFEDQEDVIRNYTASGIKTGKVQISSGVETEFPILSEQKKAVYESLNKLSEKKYLHQSVFQRSDLSQEFFEDLDKCVQKCSSDNLKGYLRSHFHVPVFLEELNGLNTTQKDIKKCLKTVIAETDCRLLEVETYSWNILSGILVDMDICMGIARELKWSENIIEGI